MDAKGKFSILCNRYRKSYDFYGENVKFIKYEKKGGNQIYLWDKHFNCTECRNYIHVRYEVYVSPDGEIIDKKLDILGAVLLEDYFEFKV